VQNKIINLKNLSLTHKRSDRNREKQLYREPLKQYWTIRSSFSRQRVGFI